MGVRVTRIGKGDPLASGLSSTGTVVGTDVDWGTSAGDVVAVLDDLVDVNAPAPADGDILTWDDGAGEWVAAVGGGGSGYMTTTGGGKEVVSTVADAGATETLDLADGNVHDVTLSADCTISLAGATAGVACSMTLLVRQDGTGGWEVTWPGSVVWPGGIDPVLAADPSAVDVFALFSLDGGTVWYGFPTGGGSAPGAGDTSGQFIAGWDGGGSAITTTAEVDIVAPFAGTITGWTMLADQSGSAVVDIWNDAYASYPPAVADTITASAKPTLSAATKAAGSPTGWTTAVAAGDVLRFHLDSASTITRLVLVVAYSRP